MTDFQTRLARYGIRVEDCPDRLQLIALCASLERLEEMVFALQHDVAALRGMILEMREK
jgi:hypothetical protein